MLALKKLLGWMDNHSDTAISKIRLYSKMMSLSGDRLPKLLMMHRIKSCKWSTLDKAYTLTKPDSNGRAQSYFLTDILNIISAIKGQSAASEQVLRPRPFTYTDIKLHIPTQIKKYISAQLNSSFASSRHASAALFDTNDISWKMSPHIADILDGDLGTEHLILAQYLCHGHGLASSIDKLYKHPAGSFEHCPCCLQRTSENVTHNLLLCQGKIPLQLRNRFMAPFLAHMGTHTEWQRKWDASPNTTTQTHLLLTAPAYPKNIHMRKTTMSLLAKWLKELRTQHPLYGAFVKGKGLKAVGVKYHKRYAD
jgi:hypothetical protein